MGVLIRTLLLLILALGATSLVRRFVKMLEGPKDAGVPPSPPSAHLVKDPICDTYVPQATALPAFNEFFCSEECRAKFQHSRER